MHKATEGIQLNTTENIQMNRVTCFWSRFYTEKRREERERGKGWGWGVGWRGSCSETKKEKNQKKIKKSEPLLIGQHIH